MKVMLIFGTRPEIIKLAPVINQLQKRQIDFSIVHTGQHFSDNMDKIFWNNLDLPSPNHHLGVREPTHATQTAEMMKKIDAILEQEKPDWVLVHGDTNSTLAGALAAVKHSKIQIGHVEAGLRSFDRSMPEEVNRVIVDHVSHLLFAPTEEARLQLLKEGISDDKIVVTGNTIEDVLLQSIVKAEISSQIMQTFNLKNENYLLMTLHRQENTDDETRLHKILNVCFDCAKEAQYKCAFPIHPRTRQRLQEQSFKFPEHVIVMDPVGYHDFLMLEKNAKIIVTDSGGLQEEGCLLKVPCITLRENTERPETVNIGANVLAGVTEAGIRKAFDSIKLNRSRTWQSPYGGGHTASRIIDCIVA